MKKKLLEQYEHDFLFLCEHVNLSGVDGFASDYAFYLANLLLYLETCDIIGPLQHCYLEKAIDAIV